MKLDIHNYPLRLQRESKYLENSPISQRNKDTIRKFHDDCAVQDISQPRLVKLMEVTRSLALILNKDFDRATIEDVKTLVRVIESKDYSPWTKMTFRCILKKFYKWLKGNNEEYPQHQDSLSVANPFP